MVSGFTFIKNGLTLGYPIKESIESIEPLCDEVVINVGFDDQTLAQDDGTFQYLRDHFTHSKFVFLKSHWDPALTKSGQILAQQTNIALEKCRGDIGQYIQGDEVIHEADLPAIHDAHQELLLHPKVDGLVFNYLHFYGNVDVLKHTRTVYRREVRAIRLGRQIQSWKDAQGFRHANRQKLLCSPVPARIFHYGWARQEMVMAQKVKAMDRLYHGPGYENQKGFQYRRIWGLKKFTHTHPALMHNWIDQHKNPMDILNLPREWQSGDLSTALCDAWENLTGHRLGEYKNYRWANKRDIC